MTSPYSHLELTDQLSSFALAAIVSDTFGKPEDDAQSIDLALEVYEALVCEEGDDRAYEMVWNMVAMRYPDYEERPTEMGRFDRILIGNL